MTRIGMLASATTLALGLAIQPVLADAIPGLFNTGVDALGQPLSNGAADLHYVLNGSGTPVVFQHPLYFLPSDARFIAAGANGVFTVNPNLYTLTFDLTGFNPLTASISGSFGTDDAGTVSLNSVLLASSVTYSSLTPFSASTGFLPGLNVLSFSVQDIFGPPSALGVTGLTGTATLQNIAAVPVPLAGAGLPGLVFAVGAFLTWCRRKTRLGIA